ncbi:membrane protein S1 [Saimiriine betaherpesvirus 4]|uniref:Membrane protein S1 n=1 Tax=Saimiriine betaherpesvirus 4 TaxID=1535247 RepID=G8XSR9_9BETA|nr:membrane protein S1 [Saimiriine betaherpesvirus 4]AEV80967.1 membrane protein S1 [Saimiriine betaherpesvirus 4]
MATWGGGDGTYCLLPGLLLLFRVGPGGPVSQTSSTPLIVNGVLGESVTLPLEFPAGEKIKSITWHYNGTSIAFIAPSEAKSPQIHLTNPKLGKRLNFTQSYSLQLSNLEMEDTGSYSALMSSETTVNVSSYTLRIFRKLKNIQVSNHSQLSQNRICEIHLTCSVEDPNDNISFKWEALGKTLLREPNLTTSWDPRNSSEQNYTCIAENAVSNLSFTVSAQKLCEVAYMSTEARMLVAALMTCLVIICLLGLFLVWKRRRAGSLLCIQLCFSHLFSREHQAETLIF